MDELARLLTVERHLLELLLFRLVVRRHLLAAGETRFLSFAATEVEAALERAQLAELRRSLFVHDLTQELSLPEEDFTLRALARYSQDPFRMIFADHGDAFFELATEIDEEGLTIPSLVEFCTGRPA